MKKDIEDPKVEDIAIAAVLDQSPTGEEQWYIYLINLKNISLNNVLVSSKGYGQLNEERIETSQLRHYIAELPAKSYARIEPIMPELFGISNQYWVSFYLGKQIYDKKYVFVAESIREENFTELPLMGRKGVMLS